MREPSPRSGTSDLRRNTYIGTPIERIEDLRFLRGRGSFLDDLSRSGQWHASFVRSPLAHGTIRGIDTRAALAIRGVRAVIAGADIGPTIPTIPFRRPNPTIAPYAQPVIATKVVRYVGEPVAMVLADAPELAEDAALAVELDIAPLPVVADRRASVPRRWRRPRLERPGRLPFPRSPPPPFPAPPPRLLPTSHTSLYLRSLT